VAAKGLSVRDTERLVRRLLEPPRPAPAPTADPDVRRLQDNLAERLGAAVRIQHGRGGKGKLVIPYNSLDELDGIIAHIK
jgi:ParB family chromosome partitioning protein